VLDRPVAIKVLRPEAATASSAERFLREARVLAKLDHPNIVTIHQAGQAGGLFYFVMDRIEGETLADRLARRRLLQLVLLHARGIGAARWDRRRRSRRGHRRRGRLPDALDHLGTWPARPPAGRRGPADLTAPLEAGRVSRFLTEAALQP
jgi:hypothetical protein